MEVARRHVVGVAMELEKDVQMTLRKLAIALAALSITGAAVAAGNDTSRSTTGAANDASSSHQSTLSSNRPSNQPMAPSGNDQSTNAQAGSSPMGSSSSAASTGTAPSDQTNPELVRSAQQALKQKGFDAGAVDGQMGPSTEGALRKFQQAQGLPQSGNLDQQTLSALGVNQDERSMSQSATRGNSQAAQGSQRQAATSSQGTTSSQAASNTSGSYK
jgi:hypothetical protein